MTLFAGIYSIDKKQPIDCMAAEIIKGEIGRTKGKLDIFSTPYFFLIKYDFGAFGESGYIENDQQVSALAGEPFLEIDKEKVHSRYFDLQKVSEELGKGNKGILRSCNGTFSICHYKRMMHKLILATDKLGARPVYYFFNDEMVLFSSSLRILEQIKDIPKRLNLKAFIEKTVFGVFLGSQTQYLDIKVLRDGQYLECDVEKPKINSYFRWDQLPFIQKSEEVLLEECYNAFKEAVSCRSHRSNAFFSMLSGGLDSRCIVSILTHLGKDVTAISVSEDGDQDELFSKQYANRIGINIIRIPQYLSDWRLVSELIEKMDPEFLKKIKYPKLVFSGDGGSVGVGHVYMRKELVEFLRQEKIEEAIHFFLKNRPFPKKIFKKNVLSHLDPVPFNGLKRELDDLRSSDKIRAFHLFLMRNDQKRHLHNYYENIDLIGIELLLPFYDARLLEIILSAAVEPFLFHEFYNKWINLFPMGASSVPWQTYPEHAICPITPLVNRPNQWELLKRKDPVRSKSLMNECLHILNKPDFPKEIIDKRMILIAFLLQKMRIEDYSYIFKFTLNLYDYYSKCESLNYEVVKNIK